MQGEGSEARRLIDEAVEICEELGLHLHLATALGFESATVHSIEGDLVAAEGDLRRAVDLLSAMNEKANLSTVAARLAEILCRQEKEEEAEDFLRLSEKTAGADDWTTHSAIKEVRALLLARREQFEAAESLARQALALADATDDIEARGWERLRLAEILALASRPAEAASLLDEAKDLFEAKGHLVGAEEAQKALANLRDT
jgi:tetratricopeptide (TPR) repeat protein